MKPYKIFSVVLIALTTIVLTDSYSQTRAQKEADIKKLLDSRKFEFVAESATPMGGGNIRLTSSNYRVSFNKDSLDSFLPYFGIAFRSKFGSTDSPLSFSSSDFLYETKSSKKGGQTINIKINQPDDPDMMILSVSSLGYGTLQVSSVNRQPISFYGFVTALESKNK